MTAPKQFQEMGLLSTGEIATWMDVHRSTVWQWIQTKQLAAKKVGERYVGVRIQSLRESKLGPEASLDPRQLSVAEAVLSAWNGKSLTTSSAKAVVMAWLGARGREVDEDGRIPLPDCYRYRFDDGDLIRERLKEDRWVKVDSRSMEKLAPALIKMAAQATGRGTSGRGKAAAAMKLTD